MSDNPTACRPGRRLKNVARGGFGARQCPRGMGRLSWMLVLACLASGSPLVWAQYSYLEQPQEAAGLPKLQYLKLDVEAEKSSQRSSLGAESQYQRLYVAPALGISWDYFLYHPDLFNFSILAEPGYSWQEAGPPDALSRRDDVLLNGTLTGRLLQLKPYATSVFASSTHNTHQYDFFNSVIEDSHSYGVLTGYRTGPVPVTLSFQQISRDTTGFNYDTTSDQTTLDLHARNERARQNFTDFAYQYSHYESRSTGSGETFRDTSDFHYITLNDTENFEHSVLTSTLLFDQSETTAVNSQDLNLLLHYSIEHLPNLRSIYDYSFARFATDSGDAMQDSARAGLQHQLYESLTSYGDFHGSSANSSFGGSTLDLVSGGTSASVAYTKRLGNWGRLTLSDGVNFDFTDQQSSGGILLISKESHALPSGQWVRLNVPRIIVIVIVATDAAHGEMPLTENVDYLVDRTRDPWQLQRNPFSTVLTDSNNTVLVTYTVRPNPSGSYSTLSDQAQIRLDLWNGTVGFYGRYSFTENHAYDPGFVLEDVREFQAGADFYRRGLRLAANYTDRHSSLFGYYAYNLSESYSSVALPHSTIGIDLNQRWSFYPASGNLSNSTSRVTYYDFILRYDWHPVTAINWSAETGYELQRGNGLDQDLFVARTYFNWLIGKLDLHLGYEFQNQKYTAETRDRHFVFLRAKRNF